MTTTEQFSQQGHTHDIAGLEARYRHLDREVGQIRSDLSASMATQQQMNTTLQDIARKVNSPRETNWQAMIAAATLVFAMAAAYTKLSTDPLQATLTRIGDRQTADREADARSAIEEARLMGSFGARLNLAEDELKDDDDIDLELLRALRDMNARLSRVEGRQ